MVSFDVEDGDGDFLDQKTEQGGCSRTSADDDSLDQQSDLGDDGFVSHDDDDSLDQQSDQDDDCSFLPDDDDSSLDEQSGQEDDDDDFFGQEPDPADTLMAHLMGAIRMYTDRGFHSPADAGGEDDSSGTFSEYYIFNLASRGASRLRSRVSPATTDDDYAVEDGDDEDEDDPFPVQAPPATASLAAIAALEAAEPPADDCCPVCLQDGAAPGAAWKRVAACGHRFHASCVAQWLRVKLSCPVCRCRAAYDEPAPAARRRDAAAPEPHRPPLPAIVEEALAMSYEEFDAFEKSSRWMEYMATRNAQSTGNSLGESAGAA